MLLHRLDVDDLDLVALGADPRLTVDDQAGLVGEVVALEGDAQGELAGVDAAAGREGQHRVDRLVRRVTGLPYRNQLTILDQFKNFI